MNKTALTQLKEFISTVWDSYDGTNGAETIVSIDKKADELLSIERKQIEEAYWEGGQDVPVNPDRCKDYFKKTYEQ